MPELLKALPAAIRREQILSIIERRGFARVVQLSAYFGISDVTVRADLDLLAEANAIHRVHGGAISGLRPASLERNFEVAEQESAEEKIRIGRAAADLVGSHQVIMLDIGTTTTAIARALAARADLDDVTIITNALNIALELEQVIPRLSVVVTGGTLRPSQHSLVDPLGDAVLYRVRADIAFVGCNGVDVDAGISNLNLPEADMKRRMLSTAARAVVVADSSKIGVARSSRVISLSEVDLLVTGVEVEAQQLETLRNAHLEVLTA